MDNIELFNLFESDIIKKGTLYSKTEYISHDYGYEDFSYIKYEDLSRKELLIIHKFLDNIILDRWSPFFDESEYWYHFIRTFFNDESYNDLRIQGKLWKCIYNPKIINNQKTVNLIYDLLTKNRKLENLKSDIKPVFQCLVESFEFLNNKFCERQFKKLLCNIAKIIKNNPKIIDIDIWEKIYYKLEYFYSEKGINYNLNWLDGKAQYERFLTAEYEMDHSLLHNPYDSVFDHVTDEEVIAETQNYPYLLAVLSNQYKITEESLDFIFKYNLAKRTLEMILKFESLCLPAFFLMCANTVGSSLITRDCRYYYRNNWILIDVKNYNKIW